MMTQGDANAKAIRVKLTMTELPGRRLTGLDEQIKTIMSLLDLLDTVERPEIVFPSVHSKVHHPPPSTLRQLAERTSAPWLRRLYRRMDRRLQRIFEITQPEVMTQYGVKLLGAEQTYVESVQLNSPLIMTIIPSLVGVGLSIPRIIDRWNLTRERLAATNARIAAADLHVQMIDVLRTYVRTYEKRTFHFLKIHISV
jgi:hypothetical protein